MRETFFYLKVKQLEIKRFPGEEVVDMLQLQASRRIPQNLSVSVLNIHTEAQTKHHEEDG